MAKATSSEPTQRTDRQGTGPSPLAAQALLRATATVACGQTITKDTTLTADVGPCDGDGIIIGADNIRLNLNGRRVLGNTDQGASGEFAGIRLAGRTGVTVTGHPGKSRKTGTVSGFEAGVVIDGGSANTVENLTARDNIGRDDAFNAELGDGIIIFDSPSNRILNNIVVHNGIFDGIGVLGQDSDNTTIQGNTVDDTVGPRPEATSSVGGPAGQGIIVNGADGARRGQIAGTNIEDNTIRRSGSGGISNINHVDASILRNTVEGNGLTNRAGNGIGIQAGIGFRFQTPLVSSYKATKCTAMVLTGSWFDVGPRKIASSTTTPPITMRPSISPAALICTTRIRAATQTSGAATSGAPGSTTLPAPQPAGAVHRSPGARGSSGRPDLRRSARQRSGRGHGPRGPRLRPQPEGPEGDPSCLDGVDNDYDDETDGDDSNCKPFRPTEPEGFEFGNCDDGVDNDRDLFVDESDAGCGERSRSPSGCFN